MENILVSIDGTNLDKINPRGIIEYADNEYYISTKDNGLLYFNENTHTWQQILSSNNISFRFLNALVMDDNKRLWMGNNSTNSLTLSSGKYFFNKMIFIYLQ